MTYQGLYDRIPNKPQQLIRVKITCYLLLTLPYHTGNKTNNYLLFTLDPHTLQVIRVKITCYLLLTGAGVSLRPPDIQYVAQNSHYLVLTGVGWCHKTPRYTVCLA